MAQGPVDLGGVAVTNAYDPDAEWIIHAAAIPHYGDGKATRESIADATRNALERADDLGAESLVVPARGRGVAGFDLADGARIVCEEIAAFEPTSLADVRFVGYGDDEVATIRAAAADV
jgi:O-acetyl-ADP-ribose deacetylase (regulator of RNase III)